jgi:BirA family biotin operon repressor/biotin-[acetyl-CoA-carboxylase] ligase
LVAGVALSTAVAGHANISELQLKWPNDLMVGSAKLGGILLERSGDAVVCGIGVNLGWAPRLIDRSTVSLANLGHRASVDHFAARLVECFADGLTAWRGSRLADLRRDWLSRAHPVGTPLSRTDQQGNRLTGTFDGLEEDGSLRLRAPDGALIVMSSGEVMLG